MVEFTVEELLLQEGPVVDPTLEVRERDYDGRKEKKNRERDFKRRILVTGTEGSSDGMWVPEESHGPCIVHESLYLTYLLIWEV